MKHPEMPSSPPRLPEMLGDRCRGAGRGACVWLQVQLRPQAGHPHTMLTILEGTLSEGWQVFGGAHRVQFGLPKVSERVFIHSVVHSLGAFSVLGTDFGSGDTG